VRVLLAHADGEQARAEELAGPLTEAGYELWHHGAVVVGDSITSEASRVLAEGGPVVVCGTVRAMGTRMPNLLAHAARSTGPGVRVFVVHMERDANIDVVSFGTKVAAYWQDPQRAIQDLLAGLAKHWPLQLEEPDPAAWSPAARRLDREIGPVERDRHRPQLFRAAALTGSAFHSGRWTEAWLTALRDELERWADAGSASDDDRAAVADALDRLRILSRALQAEELLVRLGARSLSEDFLAHLSWLTVSGMAQDGASLQRRLVLAASVRDAARGPVRVALARYVLAIASYLSVSVEAAELADWLDEQDIQQGDAKKFLRELGKPFWLLVDFGDERRTPPDAAPSAPAPDHGVQVRGVLYAPEHNPRQLVSSPARTHREAVRDLMCRVHADRRVVVDLALPADLLTAGIEHLEVVAKDDQFVRLSSVCATRLRWSVRLHHRSADFVRLPSAETDTWAEPPYVLSREIIGDRSVLRNLLDSGTHLRYPYLLATAADDGYAALRMLLRSGSHFIIWISPNTDPGLVTKIERIAASLPAESRRFGLPERLLTMDNRRIQGIADNAEYLSLAERCNMAFIWDDPDGRDGYTEYMADFLTGLDG